MLCTSCKTSCPYAKCEICKKVYCDQIDCQLKNTCDNCNDVSIYESEEITNSPSEDKTDIPIYTQTLIDSDDSQSDDVPTKNYFQTFIKVLFYGVCLFLQLVVVLDAYVAKQNYIELLANYARLYEKADKCTLSSIFLPKTINFNI